MDHDVEALSNELLGLRESSDPNPERMLEIESILSNAPETLGRETFEALLGAVDWMGAGC